MGVSDFAYTYVYVPHASVDARRECHIPWNCMVVSYHLGAGDNGT